MWPCPQYMYIADFEIRPKATEIIYCIRQNQLQSCKAEILLCPCLSNSISCILNVKITAYILRRKLVFTVSIRVLDQLDECLLKVLLKLQMTSCDPQAAKQAVCLSPNHRYGKRNGMLVSMLHQLGHHPVKFFHNWHPNLCVWLFIILFTLLFTTSLLHNSP
jgi:hypothetical protein